MERFLSFIVTLVALTATLTIGPGGCAGPDPTFGTPQGPDADGGQRPAPALEPPQCQPNNDDKIELSELQLEAGARATYRVNPVGTVVPVDVEGRLRDATPYWDLSDTAGELFDVRLEPIADQWFAGHFTRASYAVAADPSGKTLQVLELDGNTLLLLGLASRTPDRTLMVYEPPIVFLRFPLEAGNRALSEGSVSNGRLEGLPIATRDTYEVEIDASGTLELPGVALTQTLRIRTKVTSRAIGGVSATVHQVQWFHECYGEVARAVSQRDEPSASFEQASELRRLAF